MPSASNKTENKAPPEAHDPFKAAQSVVEKKVRNLEKRKGKLDLIREKRDQGEKLNADQQKAIDAYDGVIGSLEVTKDLQKQFVDIQGDIEKQLKKQARKERAEKRAAEVRRLHEMLQLQTLLDCLGTDTVRGHFKTGKHNAKVLTEENLTQLDDLYKLISPNRDEPNYEEQLNNAAEHVYSYLEGREADVAGSTYSSLKKLVDEIVGCGYFEKYPYEVVEHVVEEDPAEVAPPKAAEPEPEVEQEKVPEEPPQKVVESRVEEVAHPVVVEQQVAQHAVPQQQQQQQQQSPQAPQHPAQQPDMSAPLMDQADPTQYAEDDSFFSTPTFPPTEQRPFQDIVSSVQGTFNFLQESQIASDNSAPHHDPAVVAAKPMASSMHKSQTDTMRGTSFQGVSMLGNDDLTQQLAQSTQQQSASASERLADPTNPSPAQQQAGSSLDTGYTPTPQDFSANLMSQNLASTSCAHTYSEHGSALGHSHSHTHSGMDQSVVMGSGMAAGQDMPHSIPLPNQSTIQDQGISQDSQGKKPFTMNPNAAMFQSMYNSSISHNPTNNTQMSQSMGSSANNSMHSDKGMNQQNDFHSNGFGSSFGGRSGGPRGGGARGGGGRGGGRGGGGMSNGYARNGSRGGGGGGGGPYNSGRGGNFNGRGGSGRGGGTYHGYPPRSDYRPEGGFQSYNNSYNSGNGFKRGGGGGGGGGSGPRGGGGGSGGVGAAMRGGPPRGGGGERGDRAGRGAPRGGYGGRPAMHQQQAA